MNSGAIVMRNTIYKNKTMKIFENLLAQLKSRKKLLFKGHMKRYFEHGHRYLVYLIDII